MLTAIGFGAVGTDGPDPDDLLEVVIRARNFDECNEIFDGDLIEELRLCAADPEGEKDTCYGDSGGPEDGVQVGLSSFDNGACGTPDGGVYTRISSYEQWIQQTICDISDFPPSYC